MAVPDFLAGLIYGMTTDNHLTEIEMCYEGGVNVDQFIKEAVADLHKGGTDWDLQAVINFGLAALNVPVMLHTCEGMGDDLHALESWATVFEHPKELTTTVTKNYLLHRKRIDTDIASFKSDWALGEYFKSGEAVADLLTTAIGPVVEPPHSTMVQSNDLMAVPDFIAGLLYGFTEVNNLTEIESCYEGGKKDIDLFNTALQDLEQGDITKATLALAKAMHNLSDDVDACKMTSMADDLHAVELWADIFLHPVKLVEVATEHYYLHKIGISRDIKHEKEDWALGNYFQAGVETADALEKLIGPVYPKNSNDLPGFTVMEVPDFIAGFLYGWTGDNNLTEIEACYTSDLPILEDLKTSVDELFHGHIIKSVEKFEKAIFNLQIAMEPCHNMSDDLHALKAWSTQFKEPAHLLEVVGLHWELHKNRIENDLAETKADFALGEYFKAGESAADAFTMLFGKVE